MLVVSGGADEPGVSGWEGEGKISKVPTRQKDRGLTVYAHASQLLPLPNLVPPSRSSLSQIAVVQPSSLVRRPDLNAKTQTTGFQSSLSTLGEASLITMLTSFPSLGMSKLLMRKSASLIEKTSTLLWLSRSRARTEQSYDEV